MQSLFNNACAVDGTAARQNPLGAIINQVLRLNKVVDPTYRAKIVRNTIDDIIMNEGPNTITELNNHIINNTITGENEFFNSIVMNKLWDMIWDYQGTGAGAGSGASSAMEGAWSNIGKGAMEGAWNEVEKPSRINTLVKHLETEGPVGTEKEVVGTVEDKKLATSDDILKMLNYLTPDELRQIHQRAVEMGTKRKYSDLEEDTQEEWVDEDLLEEDVQLENALEEEDYDTVKRLFNINPNIPEYLTNQVLILAAKNGDLKMVDTLLSYPEIDSRATEALIEAIIKGHVEVVRRLLQDRRVTNKIDNDPSILEEYPMLKVIYKGSKLFGSRRKSKCSRASKNRKSRRKTRRSPRRSSRRA